MSSEGALLKALTEHTDILDQGEAFKARLLFLQLREAEKGNTALLIHLGKQYLGQTDKATVIDGNITIRVDIEDEEDEDEE